MTTDTLCQLVMRGLALSPRPTAEDLRATYYVPSEGADAEVAALTERARRWRAMGDHMAAGDLEHDAAAVERAAHTRRAKARALRRACSCAICQ